MPSSSIFITAFNSPIPCWIGLSGAGLYNTGRDFSYYKIAANKGHSVPLAAILEHYCKRRQHSVSVAGPHCTCWRRQRWQGQVGKTGWGEWRNSGKLQEAMDLAVMVSLRHSPLDLRQAQTWCLSIACAMSRRPTAEKEAYGGLSENNSPFTSKASHSTPPCWKQCTIHGL